ncbi:hypothetical protein GCM10010965_26930 [Caldalkalibacillus thermarum]|uniref:hypothetical protein n=1 Tax=Caldalkalibacillus thermarum TaxID=296745 RepID=UPI0019B785E6|nr:hypothetical protein GCM10010965_26930 [Caldalkalibacillus thermarum]
MCHGVTISYVSRQVHLPYKTVERIYYDLAEQEINKVESSPDVLVLMKLLCAKDMFMKPLLQT